MEERKKTIKNIFENIYIMRQRISSSMHLPLRKIPLTHSQWQVLNCVGKHKSMNIKDLAHLLDISSSAATQIVNGMVNRGLLSRKRSESDRRVQNISLSEKSLNQMQKSMSKICPVFEVLDDDELKEYCRLTAKLAGKEDSGQAASNL